MSNGLLQRVAEIRDKAPAARRAILELILDDPDRVLEESFELLAERAASSVPTVMRTCRDLGFAGLREFKLALAHELALGGSPLHRRVNIDDSTIDVVAKVSRSAAASVAGVRTQLDMTALDAAVAAIASARHIDLFGAGATSWFMAQDLQARLFRLGLSANAWSDYHLQQVAAAAQSHDGVVIAISHVGGMPSLLDAVDIAAGTADPAGNALLLTVGTGLGVSFLHHVQGRLVPMPSEGGHADFPPRTPREIDLVRYLLTLYGRVDMERVVSGRGLANIADFVHGGRCPTAPEDADYPAHVTAAATGGTCASCVVAFGVFLVAFGSLAGTMAIIAVARGGVFIGGGIPRKILEPLRDGRFARAFRSKPPMTDLLSRIPVSVVLDSRAGLLGAPIHAAAVPGREQPSRRR